MDLNRRTKIVCTLGPSVNRYEKILSLIEAGMDVARINLSHGTYEEHLRVIELLQKARKERGVPLAIMLDTKGPEIRLGTVPHANEHGMQVIAGQTLSLVRPSHKVNGLQITLHPEMVFDYLEEGMALLLDDGYLMTEIVKVEKDQVILEVKNSGFLKSQKGVNLPGATIPLPALTEEDIKGIAFGCKHGVDLIAASFIRSVEHVLEIRHLLEKYEKSDIGLIAKIENAQGVLHFDSILQAVDGIMVARGDLGVELPLQEVPWLQKMMIHKCYQQGKPVITATQMLESMIKNPRPTRAEVSDVANAIYDSTSAVMLSGETAVGFYPIETVHMMRDVIVETEKHFQYREFLEVREGILESRSSSIALAAVQTAYHVQAKAIFSFTNSGLSARCLSQFRPQLPILALSSNPKTYHQLALSWGVVPVDPYPASSMQEAFAHVCQFALEKGIVSRGDLVIVTAGEPFGIQGTTRMLIIEKIPF